MERLYDDTRNHSYIGEFDPPASFSGQFSPSENLNGESATSQGDFTGATELYHDDVPLSNIVILPTSIAEITRKSLCTASQPCSSFAVQVTSTSRSSGVSRPPLPNRNNSPSVTL